MIAQETLKAFHTMWGPFPEPVLLVHKDRTILAVNDLAREAGIAVGIKCHSLNPEGAPDGHCRQCKANEALRTGRVVCTETVSERGTIRAYWMPLAEVADVYVHFGIGTAEAMRQAKASAEQAR